MTALAKAGSTETTRDLDVKDIYHQIAWFKEQKMLKDDVDPAKVMDMHYVVPLPGP